MSSDPKFPQNIQNNSKKVDLEKFEANMKAMRDWATEVGMTEQDIVDTIKEVRRRNRENRQSA